MKQFIKTTVILIFLLIIAMVSGAANLKTANSNLLFKIVRSKDVNEICYEVKTNPDGSLNVKEPIKIYWVKHTKNGEIEPLTKIQQHFSYGLKFREVRPEKAEFQFVSYSKRNFSLLKKPDGKYGVFTSIAGKEVELERVFIQIDGGTFWFPKITRVEVYTKNPQSEDLLVEVIHP